MNKVYLLFGLLSSVAIFAPDARADISLPSEKITFVHTLHTHLFSEDYLSPPSFSERQEIKVAQVCWITDTEDCGGADFVGTDGTQGTPPIEVLPPKKESCIKMGYDKTSCPEGYSPNKFCPLDEKYFAECKQDCPTGCKECEEHYTGIGEECCPGKYMECECNECKGYDYTENNIPAGYIKGESCESCNGWKYKIIPNPCTGFLDCDGKCATGSKTCLSGDKTMCEKCPPCPNACTLAECPANAVCDKEECSDKYCRTGCVDGYEWDNASQSCKSSCLTGCTSSYCPSGYTCTQDPCTGKYCKIGCSSTSKWFSEETKECCSTSYQYDESNCPLSSHGHCTSSCGNKYSDCVALPSKDPVQICGTYFATSEDKCPSKSFTDYFLVYGDRYTHCLDANIDSTCLNISKGSTFSLSKDLYCGNMAIQKSSPLYINGNNHQIRFSTLSGQVIGNAVTVENARLVAYDRSYEEANVACTSELYSALCRNTQRLYVSGKLKNVTLTTKGGFEVSSDILGTVTYFDLGSGRFRGAVSENSVLNYKALGSAVPSNWNNGSGKVRESSISDGAVMNLKNVDEVRVAIFGNASINLCNDSSISRVDLELSGRQWEYTDGKFCGKLTVNSNKPVDISPADSLVFCGEENVQVNIDSSVCNEFNF